MRDFSDIRMFQNTPEWTGNFAFTYTARLYQGQTTNFRTPGGGFAPVITLGGAHTD